MEGLNKVIIVGRLGQEPKGSVDKTGSRFVKMNVATTKSWSDDDGRQEKTSWHKVYVWGKAADACEKYLHTGSAIMVEGHLSYFKTNNTEENFTLAFISAERINFLPSRKFIDGEKSATNEAGLD